MKNELQNLLQQELDAIYIGNLNTVDEDLLLPAEGRDGVKFTWATGEARFITAEGKVHRPLHGMGNRKVLLTVTAECEGETAVREFAATVVQLAKETVVETILPVKLTAVPGTEPKLPPVVIVKCRDGRTTTLPVTWSQIGEADWIGTVDKTESNAYAHVTFSEEPERHTGPGTKYHFRGISQVRLLPGSVNREYQDRMNEYLLAQNDDSMLFNFRVACGLDSREAEPMTGWDAAECKLKGHTTGHYLSGLALAYAATGDERFREKINYMVGALAECQAAFEASGLTHHGFLSAYNEEQFDLLEVYTKYPEIWAPYYTFDKIMSGLYDCYMLAGNKQALEMESLMGDWAYTRLSRLPQSQLDTMWSMYIAGEVGAMLSTMVKLYEVTGKAEHLACAKLFLNEKLFFPMSVGVDTLEDMHGNQHIPQIIGAMDLYRVTGEKRYLDIAGNFWKIVTDGHIYTIGGVGETEMFHRAGTTCSYLTEKSAESCASYNMLRLTGNIFPFSMDGSMFDYYENTLQNHILASCSHVGDGGTTYFLPLGPGGQKEYSTTENTCCHGTGMESRYRYMEHMYAEDESALYVNLLIPSELENEIRLEGAEGCFRVSLRKEIAGELRIHIPAWAVEKLIVRVNGVELPDPVIENSYLVLPAGLPSGTCIELVLPEELRLVENNSDPSFACVARGQEILAMVDDGCEFVRLPVLEKLKRSGDLYTDGNVKMIPLNRVDLERYHVYFKR